MATRGRPRKNKPIVETKHPREMLDKEERKEREEKERSAKESYRMRCIRCGTSSLSDFYVSNDVNHGFTKKIVYCKKCVREIYDGYLKQYGDQNLAVYYTCRKADIPYIHANYLGALNEIDNPNSHTLDKTNIIGAYMKGLSFSRANGWGTCFDDSQGENNIEKLSSFDAITKIKRDKQNNLRVGGEASEDYEIIEYDTVVLQTKWGATFENWELAYLESEWLDWDEKLGGITDKTLDILVKQICYQELDIFKDRQAGTPVDKKIKTLTELLNNSGLIEKQDKAANRHKSLGMEIADIEFMRPATSGKDIFDDVDGVRNYIYGAAGCFFKVQGVENEYTRFYDKWMERYQVDVVKDLVADRNAQLMADKLTNGGDSGDGQSG